MKNSERSDYVLGALIFSICFKKPRGIEELTHKIYKNVQAKNMTRIYQCVDAMLKEGILVPVFKNRLLIFKVESSNVEALK